MNYKIIPSSFFDRQTKHFKKKYPSFKKDLKILSHTLKEDPRQGSPLGKDCYKVRMAIGSKNKGKSAGARVVTCVKIVNETIYLLSIYNRPVKNKQIEKKLDKLLKMAGLL
jgi:mRNA-degrading endonuclease RelE of RelBE toxin-antitoxin system